LDQNHIFAPHFLNPVKVHGNGSDHCYVQRQLVSIIARSIIITLWLLLLFWTFVYIPCLFSIISWMYIMLVNKGIMLISLS
jgi:hypothetical protein